ncbi:MAG TPA: hypothetical protein VHZ78_01880 [Rhizomicrobium sp.]|jgi:hypothetical protein|nr:hypothetical protein [Rhizomicrobium sp.]
MSGDDVDGSATRPGGRAAETVALAGASRATADAYLAEQLRLTRLQSDSLIEQNAFELSHLRWRRFNDQMKGALQIMVVALGLAVVTGLIVAVWNASQADGVVVEAFAVPPAFAQAGMGGDVVADDLTNKIAAIRDFADANSLAQSRHVQKDREGDIKVEIPETGVSLAQAWRYLRQWFGNERPLTGNVRMLDGGRIVLTVMLDSQTFVYTGAANQLDALEQKAAEQIFATFEPSNYILYLGGNNRLAEAYAAAGHNAMLAATDDDRGNVYSLWANTTVGAIGDMRLAHLRAQMSVAFAPKQTSGHMEMMDDSAILGHDEDVLRQARIIPNQRREDEAPQFRELGYAYAQDSARYNASEELGDFGHMMNLCNVLCSVAVQKTRNAQAAARLHDPAASRHLLEEAHALGAVFSQSDPRARYYLAVATGDWTAAIGAARDYAAAIAADNAHVPRLAATVTATQVVPLLAFAQAQAGDLAAASATIAPTPLDCYHCLRVRGVIAALARDRRQAETWFARAIAAAPSIPYAYADRGEMLLRAGDFNGAIAQFDLAHQKGPAFADPLELWGEALVASNRSDLALAKFADAARHTPNWGRLHLKWGEALLWLGRKDDAKAQFALAAALELSDAEKSERARLARLTASHV